MHELSIFDLLPDEEAKKYKPIKSIDDGEYIVAMVRHEIVNLVCISERK